MTLEQTIQMCFDRYAPSFGDRRQVLIHLFCQYGTEFEWKDGELVNSEWNKFDGKIGRNKKAIQRKKLEDVAMRFAYDIVTSEKDTPMPYEQFLDKMKEVKEAINAKRKEEKCGNWFTFKKIVLQDSLDSIEKLRSSHERYLVEGMCREYSPIFTVPKDIKKDWEDGLNEVKEILEELGIDLDSIK